MLTPVKNDCAVSLGGCQGPNASLAVTDVLAALEAHGFPVRQNRHGWDATCPLCGGARKLTVAQGRDVDCLVSCFRCTGGLQGPGRRAVVDDILGALDLPPLVRQGPSPLDRELEAWAAATMALPCPPRRRATRRRVVAAFCVAARLANALDFPTSYRCLALWAGRGLGAVQDAVKGAPGYPGLVAQGALTRGRRGRIVADAQGYQRQGTEWRLRWTKSYKQDVGLLGAVGQDNGASYGFVHLNDGLPFGARPGRGLDRELGATRGETLRALWGLGEATAAEIAAARDCDVRTVRRHLARLTRPLVGILGADAVPLVTVSHAGGSGQGDAAVFAIDREAVAAAAAALEEPGGPVDWAASRLWDGVEALADRALALAREQGGQVVIRAGQRFLTYPRKRRRYYRSPTLEAMTADDVSAKILQAFARRLPAIRKTTEDAAEAEAVAREAREKAEALRVPVPVRFMLTSVSEVPTPRDPERAGRAYSAASAAVLQWRMA